MIRINGGISAPIRINGKIDKTFPKFTVTFKDGNTTLQQVQVMQGGTATYSGTVPAKDGNPFWRWLISNSSTAGSVGGYVVNPDTYDTYHNRVREQITDVQSDIVCGTLYRDKRIILDSWDVISQRSQAGTAQNYYNVGDVKKIFLNGTIGTSRVTQPVYACILGFDHNATLEGTGITFGCFKYISDNFEDLAVADSNYGSSKADGTKTFNVSHWGNVTHGGWAGCDLRYDILGSTDVAPSGYGAIPDSSRVGYNATSTCATNPVANTLMSCLPSDLRAVMKPITKYTDNTGNSSNVAENVTSTIDYLPLLSEYEVFGARTYANQYEKNKQLQYAYFSANDKARWRYAGGRLQTCNWQLRSPSDSSSFCGVAIYGYPNSSGKYGKITTQGTNFSYGLAPIFLV